METHSNHYTDEQIEKLVTLRVVYHKLTKWCISGYSNFGLRREEIVCETKKEAEDRFREYLKSKYQDSNEQIS